MKFRYDVQGLRALSVLLVAVFHIWEGGVSGGVDIFFVVSGYFLGRGYLQRLEAGESISAERHFSRFILRTVPQVLMVLAFALVLGVVAQSPVYWREFLQDVFFSALYLENLWLIRRGRDYLARGAGVSLLQHFWAVSLIAQVYFTWYFVVRFSEIIARLRGAGKASTLRATLCVLIGVSLLWSVVETSRNPTSAYFGLDTRFWQFGVGAMLSLTLSQRFKTLATSAYADPLSWLGLGLVLSCGVLIGSHAAFPGYASLWPVGAATLLLLMSSEGRRTNAGSWLASPRLVWLGTYAFGVYLWHWPIYVVALRAVGGTPSLMLGSAVLVVSVLVAYGSDKFASFLVERGLRRVSRWILALSCVGGLAGFAAFSFVGFKTSYYVSPLEHVVARSLGSLSDLEPGALAIRSDIAETYALRCHQDLATAEVTRCAFGSDDADTVVYLVGGSHAAHWLPALRALQDERNWRIVSITKSGCVFASPTDEGLYREERLDPSCAAWNEVLLEEILEERPDLVVAMGTRPVFVDPARRVTSSVKSEEIPEGYLTYFQSLSDAGIVTLAIRDTPWMGDDIPACVYTPPLLRRDSCDRLRAEVLDDDALDAIRRVLPARTALVDMNDLMCDQTYCYAIRDGIVVYRDRHHLTATYSRALGPTLGERMDQALESLQRE